MFIKTAHAAADNDLTNALDISKHFIEDNKSDIIAYYIGIIGIIIIIVMTIKAVKRSQKMIENEIKGKTKHLLK